MNLVDAPSTGLFEPQLEFPVVGIGASAGGLEAVTEMFQNVKDDTGIAFVLVLHLDPNHESLMAELLSRKTKLNVRQIDDGDALEPNQLHVIPPGASLRLDGGTLRLDAFEEPRGLRRPIDSFFVSLAKIQGPRSAAVVLSGTGADGSVGMRLVKELGGICVAQSPDEARYDGMPFAALATELVDYTLRADEIVDRLQSYFSGNFYPDLSEDEDDIERVLRRIFRNLRDDLGHDFAGYKRATIFRRLERRLQVLEYTSIEDYLGYLERNATERRLLFQDFLINVTSFFRDPESFERLQETVIEPLIANAQMSDEVRVWVPGCSSGQEAYSLAMLIDDCCEKLGKRPMIQMFATDIDESVIQTARNARYPVTDLSDLPTRFQESYTVGHEGQFEIATRIRDMVRFSVHSLIKDAPFSKIDLISCRNLLIYLDEKLQHDVLPIFHFSLRKQGALFLGNSENITRRGELFDAIDAKSRIFARRETGKRGHIMLPLGTRGDGQREHQTSLPHERDFPRHERLDVTNATIYDHYAPPFVRVASDGQIVDSSGDLSLFLMSRPGDERHVFSLAREGIRDSVMPLLADAQRENKRLALKDVEVPSPFGVQLTDIIAHPIKDGTVAIIFNAKQRLAHQVEEYAVVPATRDQRVAELQEELQATRLLLKSKVEEIETANEELKSSNEEMMSMNEELQSANEELTTANEELKNKIDELSVANADLDNFMKASELIMVVLDSSNRIRHLTDAAQKVLPLRDTDRGRPITEFRFHFREFDLTSAIKSVFETSEVFEQSITSNDGKKRYLLRILPFFFGDGSVEGTSITLVDLTEIITLRDDLSIKTERLRLALTAGRMGMAELDVESGKFTIDDLLAEQFGLKQAGDVTFEELTKNFALEAIEKTKSALEAAIERNEGYEFDFRITEKGKEERWIRTLGLPYRTPSGDLKVVGPTMDISQERQTQDRLEMLVQEMSHRVKNLFAVIGSIVASAPKANKECEEFADSMLSRINALSQAYDLARKQGSLTGVNWVELLNRVLAPHCSGQSLDIEGPDVFVSSEILTTLTLLCHELATNALKYGAFSAPDGALSVTWNVHDDNMMDLTWKESRPGFQPEDNIKPGFGSKLVAIAVKQLNGEFQQSFSDDGIDVRLNFKLH